MADAYQNLNDSDWSTGPATNNMYYGQGAMTSRPQPMGHSSPDESYQMGARALSQAASIDSQMAAETGIRGKITALQAGWNVTNAIQGMFIVSLPYAVLHGGWWGVVALAGVAFICYYTGVFLVECLYDDNGKRVRNSYRAVAEACWGKTFGGRVVLFAQLTELLMTCILYVVLIGDLMEGSFPDAAIDKMGWMMMGTAVLLPCAMITDIVSVSTLSFWNAVSHVLINLVIVLYCLSCIGRWSLGSVGFGINIETFPTVLGIVVFSYTSHIFLPTLEGSLMDRTQFRPMLKWTHVSAALFKALFGLIGYLTFAEYTQEEVTNNLPSQQFKGFVNMILVVKAVLSYPLPFFAAVQIIEHEFFTGHKEQETLEGTKDTVGLVEKKAHVLPSCFSGDGGLKEWALASRVVLILFTLFMALSIPHFALLMGLVGNITGTMLSFVWPSLFHLKLRGHLVSHRHRVCNWIIVGMGIGFGIIGIYYSSIQLFRSVNAFDEYA